MADFTSAAGAPIFKNGGNYRGLAPRLPVVCRLREWAIDNLATELKPLRGGVIVPLGTVANQVIDFLNKHNKIGSDQLWLKGFPDRSGANGPHIGDFKKGRKEWRRQLAALVR